MSDLQHFHAKICVTAAGWLLYQDKLLLVHHKKLRIWLTPGGHVEENELPHQAAEREFWEETGVKVRAVQNNKIKDGVESQFLPTPIASNLHWVCKENYDVRHGKAKPSSVPEGWRKRGCEQHLVLEYLMEPVEGVKFKHNVEETLDIGWFSKQDIDKIDTTKDIRAEMRLVFELGIN